MKHLKLFEKFGKKYVDLFIDYDNQPEELAELINMYGDKFADGMDYAELEKFLKHVEKFGYTFDYSLDAEPYGLRPIGIDIDDVIMDPEPGKQYSKYDKKI